MNVSNSSSFIHFELIEHVNATKNVHKPMEAAFCLNQRHVRKESRKLVVNH